MSNNFKLKTLEQLKIDIKNELKMKLLMGGFSEYHEDEMNNLFSCILYLEILSFMDKKLIEKLKSRALDILRKEASEKKENKKNWKSFGANKTKNMVGRIRGW